MKKMKFLISSTILGFFIVAASIVGCQKDSKKAVENTITSAASQSSIPKVLYGTSYNDLKIPDGTTTEVLNDGSTVKFNFPKGIFLVRKTKEGEISKFMTAEYTCEGKCTEGCDVVILNKKFYCSQCEPSTITCTGKSNVLIDHFEEAAFINFDAGISFVKTKEEAVNLFKCPDFLFDIPEISKAIKAFNLENYGTEIPYISDPKQYREVALNLFGCLVTYLIPKNSSTSKMIADELLESKFECDCDSEREGCTKELILGMIKTCKSGKCSKCTMVVF